MPIDYSKFDNIGCSDDEDDGARAGGGAAGVGGEDWTELIRSLQQRAGEQGAPVAPPEPLAASCPWDPSELNPMLHQDDEDDMLASLGADRGGDCKLDFDELGAEARRRLIRMMLVPQGLRSVRALMMHAELYLASLHYRESLVTALVLQLVLGGGTAVAVPRASSRHSASQGGWWGSAGTAAAAAAAASASAAGLRDEWAAPITGIKMIACYQLGDRVQAVTLRTQLQDMDCTSCSQYLRGRIDGTSEVLDLVPQFLDLLQAANKAEGTGSGANAEEAGHGYHGASGRGSGWD